MGHGLAEVVTAPTLYRFWYRSQYIGFEMTRGGRALGPRLGDAGRRTSCSGSRSRRHAYAPPQNLIDRLWPYFMIDRLCPIEWAVTAIWSV